MVYLKVMVAWNCATEECGVQCVMTFGTMMMQLWCADSWDIMQTVCYIHTLAIGNLQKASYYNYDYMNELMYSSAHSLVLMHTFTVLNDECMARGMRACKAKGEQL